MSTRSVICIGLFFWGAMATSVAMAATLTSVDKHFDPPIAFEALPKLLGMSRHDDLKKLLAVPTEHGTQQVRLQQMYSDQQVFGAGLVVERDNQGQIINAVGTLALGLDAELPERASLPSAQDAWVALPQDESDPRAQAYKAKVAAASAGRFLADKFPPLVLSGARQLVPATLGIVAQPRHSKWAYRMMIEYPAQQRVLRVVVNAVDGSVLRVADDSPVGNAGAEWVKVIDPVKPVTAIAEEFTVPTLIKGTGGNLKIGHYTYGLGATGEETTGEERPALDGLSNTAGTVCTLSNPRVSSRIHNESSDEGTPWVFPCPVSNEPIVNGAFSPINDAHYLVETALEMYREYVNVPAFSRQLIVVSRSLNGARWNPPSTLAMDNGDEKDFYSSAVPDVVGHELGHGLFLDNNLDATHIFDGIYDSFPDVIGASLRWYVTKQQHFLIASDTYKDPDGFMRDMCTANVPPSPLNGLISQAFCKLAKEWGTGPAFAMVARANLLYWNDPFDHGGTTVCGLERAAKDIGQPSERVTQVFDEVGRRCIEGIKLVNGEAYSGPPIYNDSPRKYFFDVPQGTRMLHVSTPIPPNPGWRGDLLIRQGQFPTDTEYDCRDSAPLPTCQFANPKPGRYYVERRSYEGGVWNYIPSHMLATWDEEAPKK
ncbi:hypothetical protein [Pseudomonas fildesensis]|uniref:Peptidase M36 n=1 Tax=Pseudomonas fildesensis TaxID=1674920 RepID=A0A0J8IKP0_9PSED|nr:hypothetical protein [Pseudomonas fildesensis]KMT52236.1 hypothetical protein ACR52_27925 [Pseudomonas fildesensis]